MAVKKKRGPRPIYKVCPDCTRRLRIAEDFYHWLDEGKDRTSRICRQCTCRRSKKRRDKIKSDPYLLKRERARQNKWGRGHPRNAERCRIYREKLKRERPEVYQQQLEDSRIRSRAKREGKPLVSKRAVVVEPRVPRLPVEPLVRFLNHLTIDDLQLTESNVRAVYRVLREHPNDVSVVIADRLITQCGGALSNVYPELYS
jgi:hypothetical protein